MNKDEIKKALELCVADCCEDCPYYNHRDCLTKTQQDALDLITEQEKEIEQLKANGYRNIMDAFEDNRNKIVENIRTELDDYKQSIKQAKIDILNELKEKIQNDKLNDNTAQIIIDIIEELKK